MGNILHKMKQELNHKDKPQGSSDAVKNAKDQAKHSGPTKRKREDIPWQTLVELPNATRSRSIHCSICLDTLEFLNEHGLELMCTPCGHVFCSPCVRTYMTECSLCPVCRVVVPMKSIHVVFLVRPQSTFKKMKTVGKDHYEKLEEPLAPEEAAKSLEKSVCCCYCLKTSEDIKKSGQKMKSTPCGHLYCDQCSKGRRKGQYTICRICRTRVSKRSMHFIYL